VADVTLLVTVSRESLALAPLLISRGGRYYLGPQFLGGQVQWNRTKVTSPWIDGEVTTQRTRQNVTEPISVEIKAPDQASLDAWTTELLEAFLQDSYTLTVTVDGQSRAYACEAADYQCASWTTPRMVAYQGQVVFAVPRQPILLAGVG
jgi:hypothetical protein